MMSIARFTRGVHALRLGSLMLMTGTPSGLEPRPKRDHLKEVGTTLTSMHSRLVMSSSSIIRRAFRRQGGSEMVDGFARRDLRGLVDVPSSGRPR
jgi:hypothetical protein